MPVVPRDCLGGGCLWCPVAALCLSYPQCCFVLLWILSTSEPCGFFPLGGPVASVLLWIGVESCRTCVFPLKCPVLARGASPCPVRLRASSKGHRDLAPPTAARGERLPVVVYGCLGYMVACLVLRRLQAAVGVWPRWCSSACRCRARRCFSACCHALKPRVSLRLHPSFRPTG